LFLSLFAAELIGAMIRAGAMFAIEGFSFAATFRSVERRSEI
jgi:hypothetical protein